MILLKDNVNAYYHKTEPSFIKFTYTIGFYYDVYYFIHDFTIFY